MYGIKKLHPLCIIIYFSVIFTESLLKAKEISKNFQVLALILIFGIRKSEKIPRTTSL